MAIKKRAKDVQVNDKIYVEGDHRYFWVSDRWIRTLPSRYPQIILILIEILYFLLTLVKLEDRIPVGKLRYRKEVCLKLNSSHYEIVQNYKPDEWIKVDQ